MKKFIANALLIISLSSIAQKKETFDLVTYTAPKGWKKDTKENVVGYSIIDNKKRIWCQLGVIKSTISKGSIEKDFESEWAELVIKPYNPTGAPDSAETQEADGWKIKAGVANFVFNNSNAVVLLTTMSGFGRVVSIVATTNNNDYLANVETFLASVDLSKPTSNNMTPPVTNTNVTAGSFAYGTTNFDDGWKSVAKEDWVEVTKGTVKVLMHYPNKLSDAYNSVLLDGLKNAWNVLVAPKYSSATNMEFKPKSGWESIEFAEASMIEKGSGRSVYVILFKKNFSSGTGRYLEFIAPDKNSFVKEFGNPEITSVYGTDAAWDKMINMVNYNKFGVGASDLKGKWVSNFTGMQQYVNAYTGANAGMNTHASNESFEFGVGNNYKWDLGVASGFVGNIKFQSVKSTGKWALPSVWQIQFSDIEGKPRTYDVFFRCIKGARVLWIGETAFGKSD